MNKLKLNSITMNWVLIGSIVLLVGAAGVGYYYGSKFLKDMAQRTDHAKTDATIAAENLAQLQRLETEMKKKQEVILRAQQIVAQSSQYRYQDQIVQDINTFAGRADVAVTGYDFGDPSKTKSSSEQSVPNIKGLKLITANIQLATPVNFDNFLRFLKAIEQNLTKMQITGVNMTPDTENVNAISNPTVGLQIYIRE